LDAVNAGERDLIKNAVDRPGVDAEIDAIKNDRANIGGGGGGDPI